MLERPALSDDQIATALQSGYGIRPSRLDFLPVGNDPTAWSFRVTARGGRTYFLKARQGGVPAAALSVPRFLRGEGVEAAVAPLPARQGSLAVPLGEYTLVLYPYAAGNNGMEAGLSDGQWAAFGAFLREVHAARLPAGLAGRVERETFLPPWEPAVRRLSERVNRCEASDPLSRELAAFWKEKEAAIQHVVERAVQLGGRLRCDPPPFVLCHSDIHTANLIVDPQGGLHVVDWDGARLAPRERDLMFITSTPGDPAGAADRDVRLFFNGYGPARLDPAPLSFYQYEWVVQEIGDFGTRVFERPGLGAETRAVAVQEFRDLFRPGDVVEIALKNDREER